MLVSTVIIVGIVFIGLGFLLLLIRLFRMTMYFNNMWNDSMPWYMSHYLITTAALCGVTIIATSFSSPLDCENGCFRSGKKTCQYSAFFGLMVLTMCWWAAQSHNEQHFNIFSYFSGVDVSLIAIGACILLSDLSLGTCPATCVT